MKYIGDIIFASFFVAFLIWAIRLEIILYKDRKLCVEAWGPDWNKRKPTPIVSWEKICTQHQPFRVDDKRAFICNFACDGNCHLINLTQEELIERFEK